METNLPDFFEHPMFWHEGVVLDTPPLQALRDTVQGWLWTGASGGYITGESRVGKTFSLKQLVKQLRTRAGAPVPAFLVPAMRATSGSSTTKPVKEQICYAVGLHVGKRRTDTEITGDLVHFFLDSVAAHHSREIVLFADEIQRLRADQIEAFANIYDYLLLQDVTLMTVFAANTQDSSHLLETLQDGPYAHIRGRFFTRHASFLGLTSREDVKVCLEQWDQLRYPPDGPSYVAHLLPDAVARGWRLADQAPLFWRVFRDYQKTYKLRSWPMDYFVEAIRVLLIDFLPRYGVERLDEAMFHGCVEASKLIPDLVKQR